MNYNYVLGFMFDYYFEHVCLIQKTHPAWQAGFFNGVGGSIKTLETPYEAMCREFLEETGVKTNPTMWFPFATMKGPDWNCICFRSACDLVFKATTTTEEEIQVVSLEDLHRYNLLPNAFGLIRFAMEHNLKSCDIIYEESSNASFPAGFRTWKID